jgi:5,10-methylenetetrahydrofolate reductase
MKPPVAGFREQLARGFVVTVELDPPRGTDLGRALGEAAALRGRVAAVNIADSPMANLRMSPIALACLVRGRVGIDTIFHLTCRDRNLLGLQSELLGAWALGVHNILALTGDPPERGDHPQSAGVFQLDGIGLMRLASALNRGEDANGRPLHGGTDFLVGAAANPAAPDLAVEISKLRAKIAAGAHFSQTQPVYRRRDAEGFLAEARALGFPVLVGLLPVKSHRMLRYLDENVPGIRIPVEVRDRLAKTPAERVRAEGVLLCRELIAELRGLAAGVHLMPVGDPALVPEILGPAPAGEAPPEGGSGRPELEKALRAEEHGGRISCAAAFDVAERLAVPAVEVGRAIERLGLRISGCRLGCF